MEEEDDPVIVVVAVGGREEDDIDENGMDGPGRRSSCCGIVMVWMVICQEVN
jgi:hypothetical protein